jgi:hypothetical protein
MDSGCIRALPLVAMPNPPSRATGRVNYLLRARRLLQFFHQQHSIAPIMTLSTPKIPSANLLSQPHPPNTKNASSLILL